MLIEVQDVCKEIKGKHILNDVNLNLYGGNIYGLQGENGSGKTMFMRCLAGLLNLDKGRIIINHEILKKDIDFPRSIGVLLENPSFLDDFSGIQNLMMLASLKGLVSSNRLKDVLQNVGLNPSDKKKYRKYSLGMKQRLGIAAAIMEEPDIILLDEPFNALDDVGKKQIELYLIGMKRNDRIIIFSCHDQTRLERIADKIIYVDQGTLKELK